MYFMRINKCLLKIITLTTTYWFHEIMNMIQLSKHLEFVLRYCWGNLSNQLFCVLLEHKASGFFMLQYKCPLSGTGFPPYLGADTRKEWFYQENPAPTFQRPLWVGRRAPFNSLHRVFHNTKRGLFGKEAPCLPSSRCRSLAPLSLCWECAWWNGAPWRRLGR